MLMPKEDRKKIYSALFASGVLVAAKNFEIQHDTIDTKNLYVIKALQSLDSRGYVKTQFSWQYYYYTLTEEGVEYLREWLHLPDTVSPITHREVAAPTPVFGRPRGGRPNFQRDNDYRRREKDIPAGTPSFA
ncbi:hypothetical protein CANCADRAFT_531 [Tortispora caseinolytica NRRL Y-17796]|uniref:Plectin/eS10 N-terminal domain-containing protein n=1 Tax=Tortispora caseinolytica NRRL Y-17796 TaxID=767744 RepID=A0A1E4TJM6_9ASCO|nr:hypothetical protein CANCADRAFT_531 [Tortispora caseinolytica NRRL Y-17796]